MVTIQDYIEKQLQEIDSIELSTKLGVSISMLSAYKKSYKASLTVAKRVYSSDKITLHPFSEESLLFEVNK